MLAVSKPERTTTDAEAIRCSLTDPTAFVLVFDRHFSLLYKFLAVRVGRDAAEDLAAETFAIAFDRRSTYDPTREDARPWLFGIAVNLIRTHARRHRRLRDTLERIPRERGEGEARVDSGDIDAVRSALLGLDDLDKNLLLLFACAELPYAEIAEALELPVGTVRSRLHRARLKLRRRLTEEPC
jgi:RNA polymerase sigma factor (sigma-70 family)